MPEVIPKEQLAAVAEDSSGVTIKTIPVVQSKDLDPGRALVKILFSGVCHTDLHVIRDEWPVKAKRPCIAGHEGAGIIVALNDPTSRFSIGQKVGVKWIGSSCNQCEYCLQGDEMLCPEALCSGLNIPGTFQQYCPAYTSQLTPIPDGIELSEAAPILCAGVTVYKALKVSGARSGQWVCIPGAGGGLGSLACQYARYMGLSVIAVDTGEEKRKLCEANGAAAWVDFKETKDIVKAIKEATPDKFGPHAAIVTSPKPEGYEQAMAYIRPKGVVVAVGLPSDGASVKADVFFTVLQAKSLVGSYVGNRLDAIEALRIAANGHVKCTIKVQPFNTLSEVLEQMDEGKLQGRVVLDCKRKLHAEADESIQVDDCSCKDDGQVQRERHMVL